MHEEKGGISIYHFGSLADMPKKRAKKGQKGKKVLENRQNEKELYKKTQTNGIKEDLPLLGGQKVYIMTGPKDEEVSLLEHDPPCEDFHTPHPPGKPNSE